jgi:WD40 repeat protein
MELEDAIRAVDLILHPDGLNDLQEQIFRRTWVGQKYPDIAEELGYDANYVKDLGAKIWKQLSGTLGERVTKANIQSVLRRQIVLRQQTLTDSSVAELDAVTAQTEEGQVDPARTGIQDWGDVVDTASFIGRQSELATLSQWIEEDGCRLIAVLGMGGMGKTMLAARLAEQVEPYFEIAIWRSLKHAPPLDRLLQDLLQRLRVFERSESGDDLPKLQLSLLLEQLRARRCLIVLDNAETLVEAGGVSGDYRLGYEGYGELFKQIGSTRHQSCLLVTSREKPKEWIPLEGLRLPVRSFQLDSLSIEEAQTLLNAKGSFEGDPALWSQLIHQYGGNPLALQIVATTILDLFQGNLADFLGQGQVVFESLSAFLQEQWSRLSIGEQLVLFHLVVRRDESSLAALQEDLLDKIVSRHLIETINALIRRSLIEKNTRSAFITFTLQPVVLEYTTQRLIQVISTELILGQFVILHQCPLLKIRSKDYIQQAQRQLILKPILEKLKDRFSTVSALEAHLKALLVQLQVEEPVQDSYSAGNILNLSIELGISLAGYDLSHLSLWELNVQSVALYGVNLSDCDLSRTLFANAFGGVLSAALSPSGQWLATGHEEGHLRIWEAEQGRQLNLLLGHSSWVWSVCWSPDGERLISASEDRTLRVWDARSGDCLQVLTGHSDRIWRVIFPMHSTAVSASSDQTLKVWDLDSGECVKTLRGHQGDVSALAIANCGQQIISGGEDRTIRLWDLATGDLLETWTSAQGWIWSVAYRTTTQTILSAGDKGVIECWQRGQVQPIQQLQQGSARIWSLTVSPCDRYAVSGGDGDQLDVWDLDQGQYHQSLTGHSGRIWSVQYDATGTRIVSASDDRSIRLWDIQTGQGLLTLRSYSNWVCEVAFVPQSGAAGQPLWVASAHEDSSIHLWNIENDVRSQTLQGHQHQVWSLAQTGHTLLSCGEDRTLRLWNLESGLCANVLEGHQSRVWAVAFSPDGQLIASGSGDRTLKIWSAETGACLQTLTGHQSRVWTVAFSPDGRYVASGSGDRTLKIWRVSDGDCIATLEGHTNGVLSTLFHPQQPILISAGEDGCIKFWSLETYTCTASIPVPVHTIWSIALSPDGKTLAIGGDDHHIRLWDITQQTLQQTLSGHIGWIWSVAFSPNGQYLASGSQDGTTRIWTAQSGQCLRTLQPKRPYETLNFHQSKGLTPAQRETLKALGAIDRPV